jgi:sigma-B regulation protein RsbU (phosphoserine phosphatase)
MATPISSDLDLLRNQLLIRRQKLEQVHTRSHSDQVAELLAEVDRALERVEESTFGECEVCHGTVEAERLLADPLARVCLDCLSPAQRRALEQDLELAAQIQQRLLPKRDFKFGPWHAAYHYRAAGHVSGDYCDLVTHDNVLYFMVGDVSGKGFAASMLMSNLHAMFRVLIPAGMPLEELMQRASRMFCESTLPTQFATLVAGKALACGEIEICNAGHPAPLLVSPQQVSRVEGAGLPVGMFSDATFCGKKIQAAPGDALVIFTDGVAESRNQHGAEYGDERLRKVTQQCRGPHPQDLVNACVADLEEFDAGGPLLDDQTLMALRFNPEAA